MENLEKNKIKDKIGKVTLGLLLILILVSIVFSVFYNFKLQEQVDKRDFIIEQLTQRDSILNEIMEIKYDSISKTITYTYRMKNGKAMKYNELSDELDKSNDNYSKISNNHKKILGENNQTKENYTLLINDFNSLCDDYKDLQTKYNDLVDNYIKNIEKGKSKSTNYNRILDSLSYYKTVVNLIHSNYFIDYKIINDGKYVKISVISEKLDSALILLPYFRNRLKKEEKVWKITTGK